MTLALNIRGPPLDLGQVGFGSQKGDSLWIFITQLASAISEDLGARQGKLGFFHRRPTYHAPLLKLPWSGRGSADRRIGWRRMISLTGTSMSKIFAISYKGVLAEAAEARIEVAPRTGGCTTLVAGELSKRIVTDFEVIGTIILGEESLLEVKSSKGAGMMLSRRIIDTTNKGSWNQSQGNRNHNDRQFSQDSWREGNQDRGGARPSEGMKLPHSADFKCYCCLGSGHHQSECENDPICYKCKKEGHIVVGCKAFGNRKLQMFGFSNPGQGFYSINIPVAKAKEYSASGILTVLDGDATEGKIDKELKNLVKEDWDFKVKKIDKA
jgi:hypothetical protein